jgi:hypothetical protein
VRVDPWICVPGVRGQGRRLRIQQCAEGWHRDTEPEPADQSDGTDPVDGDHDQENGMNDDHTSPTDVGESRRSRSTRHRSDAPDLPHVPVEDRTVGRSFTTPDGKTYRPSMFLTLTLPSYGKIRDGAPVNPDTYDYRQAALDSILFPRLVDRFWQNLRRVAGYKVQYFAAVEPQYRLAPHLTPPSAERSPGPC